ncbi:hypothetical protein, partial [Chryseobacterium sp. CCH4-E10]|uniref:hypothetical protein n=1 Tax=Chryseobacterium sp. CCH4-E10 TaxID=1768758 RepID=UPI001E591D0D
MVKVYRKQRSIRIWKKTAAGGIKSGAISKYQRSVCLYPAAFALWLIFLTKIVIYISQYKLT